GDAGQVHRHDVAINDGTSRDISGAARYARVAARDVVRKGEHESVIAATRPAFHAGLTGERQVNIENSPAAVQLPRNHSIELQRRVLHGGDVQINIACSIINERAGKPGIGDGPKSLASWIGRQPGNDVVVESRLSAEVDKS